MSWKWLEKKICNIEAAWARMDGHEKFFVWLGAMVVIVAVAVLTQAVFG